MPVAVCDGDGVCETDEDCMGCANDFAGVTTGMKAGRYCCGDGTTSALEGDGAACDGSY